MTELRKFMDCFYPSSKFIVTATFSSSAQIVQKTFLLSLHVLIVPVNMVYALNGSDIRADGHLLLLLLLLFCVAIREEKVKKGMTDRLSIGRKQGKKERRWRKRHMRMKEQKYYERFESKKSSRWGRKRAAVAARLSPRTQSPLGDETIPPRGNMLAWGRQKM